jgi:hypothetical protein
MSVALIGLMGVIAGALIGGWMNTRLEQRRRVLDAREAQSLIAAELDDAATRLQIAIRADEWSPLPSGRWREGARPLLVAVDREIGGALNSAYGVIQAWDAESGNRKGQAPTDQEKTDFGRAEKEFRKLSKRLEDEDLKPPRESRQRGLRTAITVVAGLVVGAVLVYAAFVPRPDLTDQTIASALQSKLGGGALVACSENEDGWLCHASPPPRRRPTCGTQADTRAPRSQAELAVLVANSRCSKTPQSPVKFEVAEGSDGPLAMPTANSVRALSYLDKLVTQLAEPEESAAGSFWDRLTGRK